MSYKKLSGVEKSEKARHGRKYQYIGGNKVSKYAFSPYTAKAKQRYTFYADVRMRKGITSPDGSGNQPQEVKWITIQATVGTFIEFRNEWESGEIMERLTEIVVLRGGEAIEEVTFWRNKGEQDINE